MEIEETRMGDSFKDLIVWQRAIELTMTIYRFTSAFPPPSGSD